MAHVLIFEEGKDKPSYGIDRSEEIEQFLQSHAVIFEQLYLPGAEPDFEAGQDEIIESCRQQVNGLMQTHGFTSLDVLMLHSGSEDLSRIRANCLREHSHTGNEGRLILSGQGMFCLRLNAEQYCLVLCSAGDFLLLPANMPHWFDPGEQPRLCTVRLSDTNSAYEADSCSMNSLKRPPGLDVVRSLIS